MSNVPALLAGICETVSKPAVRVAFAAGAAFLTELSCDSINGKDKSERDDLAADAIMRSGAPRRKCTDDSSDDEDIDVFKEIRNNSPKILEHNRSKTQYVQVGKSKFFLSRDRAGHAGSYCKLYEEKGTTLEFHGSVPVNIFWRRVNKRTIKGMNQCGPSLIEFALMEAKHESRGGTEVSLSDLHRIR